MNLNAISHRSLFTDLYARNDREIVINIRTGKDVTGVNLLFDDPYAYGISGDIHWVGRPLPMKMERELKNHYIYTARLTPEYRRLQYCFELFSNREVYYLYEDDFYTREQAEKLLGFIETQTQFLETTLADVQRPDVYLAGNSSFLTTAGDAMYQSDMIRLAGGKNVAGEIPDTYWAQIDYEQLLLWDPAYIILPSSASYTVADVMADPNLAQCRAVVSGRVYQIPGDAEAWDSPVPGSILGALWLAQLLHPERMDEAACADIMDEYYETFYHFTYSEI